MNPVTAAKGIVKRNSNALLLVVCLGQFMVVLDVSIVNVALPSIKDSLGFSTDGLQWVLNGYTLTFAGFLLLGGRAADLFGRRRMFFAGTLLFSGASLLCAIAPTAGALVAARALQGIGAAILSPATLAIITTSFDEGRAAQPRARRLGRGRRDRRDRGRAARRHPDRGLQLAGDLPHQHPDRSRDRAVQRGA